MRRSMGRIQPPRDLGNGACMRLLGWCGGRIRPRLLGGGKLWWGLGGSHLGGRWGRRGGMRRFCSAG